MKERKEIRRKKKTIVTLVAYCTQLRGALCIFSHLRVLLGGSATYRPSEDYTHRLQDNTLLRSLRIGIPI